MHLFLTRTGTIISQILTFPPESPSIVAAVATQLVHTLQSANENQVQRYVCHGCEGCSLSNSTCHLILVLLTDFLLTNFLSSFRGLRIVDNQFFFVTKAPILFVLINVCEMRIFFQYDQKYRDLASLLFCFTLG